MNKYSTYNEWIFSTFEKPTQKETIKKVVLNNAKKHVWR